MSEISPASVRSRAWLAPTLSGLLFALASFAILPFPGLQDDELLFTGPIYVPQTAWYRIKLFGIDLPLMLMSYLGTLKTWVYAGLFEFFEPSRWSVRLPMVILGVVTIWLTWMWTRRIAGTRAAAFTVTLLATDAIFTLTNTFDWGPVAFQHVFLMGGLLSVQVWLEDESPQWLLAVGFFLWGLGLWDKALLIWLLSGLAVAAVCLFPRQLLKRLRPKSLGIAVGSLLLGALPLVIYNLAGHGKTLSGNTKLSVEQFQSKVDALRSTLDGSALLGSIAATTPGPIVQTPKTVIESISVGVRRLLGARPNNWMVPSVVLAILCLVFLLRTPKLKPLLFILIVTGVAWLQMALNAGTGGSAHHVILLWPFPCCFVGIAIAGVADRWPQRLSLPANMLVGLIALAGLANTNEYLADLTLNGGLRAWTDASYRLAGAVKPYHSVWIGGVDWGYMNGLRMWYEGDVKLFNASEFVRQPTMTDEGRRQMAIMTSSPDFVYIQHTEDNQMFPGVNGQFRDAASALGYTEHVLRVVHDNEGRPVFEIFRFEKVAP